MDVDQSALTGESLPATIRAGEPAMMGGTIVRGEVRRAQGPRLASALAALVLERGASQSRWCCKGVAARRRMLSPGSRSI